ncbi:hypothetical protein GCM10029992_26970 [Glycomyces albus]
MLDGLEPGAFGGGDRPLRGLCAAVVYTGPAEPGSGPLGVGAREDENVSALGVVQSLRQALDGPAYDRSGRFEVFIGDLKRYEVRAGREVPAPLGRERDQFDEVSREVGVGVARADRLRRCARRRRQGRIRGRADAESESAERLDRGGDVAHEDADVVESGDVAGCHWGSPPGLGQSAESP